MSDNITLNLHRACMLNGQRAEPGRVSVAPLIAADLLAANKGALVNDTDAPRVAAAVRAANARAVAFTQTYGSVTPPPHGPWQPIPRL